MWLSEVGNVGDVCSPVVSHKLALKDATDENRRNGGRKPKLRFNEGRNQIHIMGTACAQQNMRGGN